MKPKTALPYPRPVSPICVDEYYIRPGDRLSYASPDSDDDTESQAAQRAAKRRRRVRETAEAHLRGEQIIILTAGLRGPFDEARGWRNPWAKRKSKGNAANVTGDKEIPETTVRFVQKEVTVDTPLYDGEAVYQDVECIDLTMDDDIEFTQPPIVTNREPKGMFKTMKPPPQAVQTVLTPTSARRIEDWLRTNANFKTNYGGDIRSSPTPTNREPRQEADAKRPTSAGGQNQNTQIGEWATRFSQVEREDQQSTQQTHESQDRAEVAILEHTKRRSIHRIPPSTNLPAFEYRRARGGVAKLVLEHKAKTVEPEQQARIDSIQEESPEHVIEQEPTHKPVLQPKASAEIVAPFSVPALVTETSKATTSRELPEAQIVSEIVPPPSNVPSTADLLQPVQPPTQTTHTEGRVNETEKNTVDNFHEYQAIDQEQAPVEVEEDLDSTEMLLNGIGPDSEPLPHNKLLQLPDKENQTPIRYIDTQALLAGSVPGFEISTIKKAGVQFDARQTPVTATKQFRKPTTRSSRKKTSFAASPRSDESQSSIKNGFHLVRKSVVVEKPIETKPISIDSQESEEPYDLDPPSKPTTHKHPESAPTAPITTRTTRSTPSAINPPFKAPSFQPRSILKSSRAQSSAPPGTTMTASVPNGTTNTYNTPSRTGTGTSSAKQDAQRVPVNNMFAIENGTAVDGPDLELEGQGFDLDAVVSDLGSFLGTWDVEREAGRVV